MAKASALLGQQVTYGDNQSIRSAFSDGGSQSGGAAGAAAAALSHTLVGPRSGLQFDLIWDPSVASAPPGFKADVIRTAELYSSLYSGTKEIVAINVGYGEVGGIPLAAGDLGESLTAGYLTDYPTVTSALGAQGFSFNASNEPVDGAFFVPSAQAKSWGLADPYTTTPDGYIGFGTLAGTGYSWNTHATATGAGSGTGPNQVDLQSVIQHEMSEVMGRIGIEGADVFGPSLPTYTALDLFNYSSPGTLELSGDGGDIADWASYSSIADSHTLGLAPGDQDSYDAFGRAGTNGALSASDLLVDRSLGYSFTPAGHLMA
ncbi:MAG TPA: hypothetical protein VFW28_18340 [Micropepsaceae bacterium]|nr:hypothetical protein [Micropepsaceae bacterium]